jgi:hypothetical protein
MKKAVMILFAVFFSASLTGAETKNTVEKELIAKSGAKINIKCSLPPSWKVLSADEQNKEDKAKLALVSDKNAFVNIGFDKAPKDEKELPQKYADSVKTYCNKQMKKNDKKYLVAQEETAISGIKAIKLVYDLSSTGNEIFSHQQFLCKIGEDIVIITCITQKDNCPNVEADFKKITESIELK